MSERALQQQNIPAQHSSTLKHGKKTQHCVCSICETVMVKSPPKTLFGASLSVCHLPPPRARTFAAGVVSRVQDLVIRASTLPASRRGEAKAAAPAIVDATRVGACRQMSSTGLLSRIEPTGTSKQTNSVAGVCVSVFRHLAAAARHTCGSQRWAASRFSAT